MQITKKGKALVRRSRPADNGVEPDLAHDRRPKVILPADTPDAFLEAVGIMTADGKVRADKRRKFAQINEFLKVLSEAAPPFASEGRPLQVVDLGCGNAYLTFAAYHYFNNKMKVPATITGIDSRALPIESHRDKVTELGWDRLTFEVSEIYDVEPANPPDIVLALHACDTATDEALARSIKWDTKLILSAPCCHHELQQQLKAERRSLTLVPDLREGVLGERLGDVLTDAFRAQILRIMGYKTDVIQFVGSENTAKNILIRAVKSPGSSDRRAVPEYRALKEAWRVTPYLEQLLGEEFSSLLGRS